MIRGPGLMQLPQTSPERFVADFFFDALEEVVVVVVVVAVV